jgi:hypothetical protein
MGDLLVLNNDVVIFDVNQGAAIVGPVNTTITASAEAKDESKKICVEGDEASVFLTSSYKSGSFVTPGSGILTIVSLNADQISKYVSDNNGIKIILQGSKFNSKFTVTSPAINPVPSTPVPDPTPMYTGFGKFISSDTKTRSL